LSMMKPRMNAKRRERKEHRRQELESGVQWIWTKKKQN
jgi:hypothetical protein